MTTQLPKLSELTNEQVRVMVARMLRWRLDAEFEDGAMMGLNPVNGGWDMVPDFAEDLNAACFEMEDKVAEHLRAEYMAALEWIARDNNHRTPSARQRCDAFLLTHNLATL